MKNLILIILTCFIYNIFAQNTVKFDNKSRAKYIIDIAKQVTWPDEQNIDTFRFCVLSRDTVLAFELKSFVRQQPLIHKKPLKILYTSSYTTLPNAHLVFFIRDENYDIDKVSRIIDCHKTLLITENYAFHKSMINFIVLQGYKRYEINIPKLKECGFSVTELFAEGAVKSKADWEELYKQTDLELQKEKEIVEQQSNLIENQKKEIEKQQNLITLQQKQIAEQQKEIERQLQEIVKQKKALLNIKKQVNEKTLLLNEKIKELNQREAILKEKNKEINEKSKILANQQKEIDKQNLQIELQKKILNTQLEKIHLQQLILYLFAVLVLMLIVTAFFIYRSYKIKKEANRILSEKNAEILKQNEEIRRQNEEIQRQRDEIALQKQEIMDSIKYASRIQQAVLPPYVQVKNLFSENFFIFNRPRDIVSGDYYFITSKGNKLIVSVADCTGHGVPGAFMSILGISFLNEIISKENIFDSSDILNRLRDNIINALNQGKEEKTKDGMDMVLCIFDFEKNIIEFSGANNPLYHIRKGILYEYKGDKMPIGLYDNIQPFSKTIIPIEKGDTFYMFSDGYADQFGGPEGKKFKYKQLKELLLSIQEYPMPEQGKIIEKTIDDWKRDYFQVDDMLMIGIKY